MATDDPVFGNINFRNDAWFGLIRFLFPPAGTTLIALHIWAPETGPNDAQRAVFADLRRRYRKLWPEIARHLLNPRRFKGLVGLDSIDDLNSCVNSTVALYIGEYVDPDSAEFALVYSLDREDEGNRAHLIRLRHWQVIGVENIE